MVQPPCGAVERPLVKHCGEGRGWFGQYQFVQKELWIKTLDWQISKQVISLLAHLPYILYATGDSLAPQPMPDIIFADWYFAVYTAEREY
jgi:hypothetical protein